jgi:hypothetical protein
MKIFTIILSVFISANAQAHGQPVSVVAAQSMFAKLESTPMKSGIGQSQEAGIRSSLESCQASAATAMKLCLAELSPDIQTGSALVGGLIATIGASKSTTESCKKFGTAMDIAKSALTAYNLACSAAQIKCNSSCSGVSKTIEAVIAKINATKTMGSVQVPLMVQDVAALSALKAHVAGQQGVCGSYKLNIAAGVTGLMSIIRQSQASKSCENGLAEESCEKNPNQERCRINQDDCSLPANQNSKDCICRKAPNTPGCPGAVGVNTVPVVSARSSSNSSGSPTAKSGPSSGETDGTNFPSGSSSGSGSSSMGGGVGGGGFGGSGLNGSGAAAKTGAADGAKTKGGLNPNILSGYEGGGGGGRGGYGGSGSGAANSAYKAYLPGGAKDPQRGVASKLFGKGEVTSAGSKSNWEKVRERYQDNKPTLVGP